MPIFSPQTPDQIGALMTSLLGHRVIGVEAIGGGRNSRVYKLTCQVSGPYAVKFCRPPSGEGERDRLGTEFDSLRFLSGHGIENVPRPVVIDPAHGCAVYEYVDGVRMAQITAADIDQAVAFLADLKGLVYQPDSRRLDNASEACFSVQTIVLNIQYRLRRLSGVREAGPHHDAFRGFLSGTFQSAFDEIIRWCQSRIGDWESDVELPTEKRTLSPSDFGFHNALKRPDGRIVFLDFEHFGWDDPAKMIADFLLHPHPDMAIGKSLKRRFVRQALQCFEGQADLLQRVEIVYPLFGLKWCTILLNEFVPEDRDRRAFARAQDPDWCGVQKRQLSKAKRMLRTIRNTYQHFPSRD